MVSSAPFHTTHRADPQWAVMNNLRGVSLIYIP